MKRAIIQSTILLLTLLLVGSILAQGNQYGRASVEREIERTQRFLDQVGDILMQAEVPQAAVLLERAKATQQKAHDFLQSDNLILANRMTRAAREQAKTALSLARRVEQYDGAVQRQLEIAGDLLDRVDQVLLDQNRPGMRQMYETLRDNLTRGREFYREQQYKPAYKLANQVENAARKLLAVVGPRAGNEQDYQRRRDRLRQLYTEAHEQLGDCDSEVARTYRDQARQAYDLAEQMHGNGHSGQALETLQRARQLVMAAARECLGDQQLARQFERLESEFDQLTEQAASADPAVKDRIESLLQQADQHLKRAREEARNGLTDAAVAALKAASLTLKQVRSIMAGTP